MYFWCLRPCGDTHIAALLPLSVHQSTFRPSQQQLNHHSKSLSYSLLLCLLLQTKETTPDKRNYLLEATPISSAKQSMAEQADQQWHVQKKPSDQRKAVHSERMKFCRLYQDSRHDASWTGHTTDHPGIQQAALGPG